MDIVYSVHIDAINRDKTNVIGFEKNNNKMYVKCI